MQLKKIETGNITVFFGTAPKMVAPKMSMRPEDREALRRYYAQEEVRAAAGRLHKAGFEDMEAVMVEAEEGSAGATPAGSPEHG